MNRVRASGVLAITLMVALTSVSTASADEGALGVGWSGGAREDLPRMLRLHGWSAATADAALARFVHHLSLRRGSDDLETLGGGEGTAMDVDVYGGPVKDMPGCLLGSFLLAGPSRFRTALAGIFCSPGGLSWTYDPRYLKVIEIDDADVIIRTTSATDIGQNWPELAP